MWRTEWWYDDDDKCIFQNLVFGKGVILVLYDFSFVWFEFCMILVLYDSPSYYFIIIIIIIVVVIVVKPGL
jgi:hypothetical protein